MAKLPKNLRKSLQQPKAGAGGKGAGMKGGSRSMRRMMNQMGIDLQEIPAQEVIIKCDEYDIVISAPQVSLINQAGQEIYQILGSSEKVAKDGSPATLETEIVEDSTLEQVEGSPEVTLAASPQITSDDVKLVAMQAQVSEQVAEATLKRTNGNIAQAIIELKTKQ